MRDRTGNVVKVVKLATDVTAQKLRGLDADGQIAALHRSQAVIAFDPAGTILDANANFLDAMGYRLNEICGQHHSLFVDVGERASDAYRAFWTKLGRASLQPENSGVSPEADARSGSKQRTTRSPMRTGWF